MTARGLLEERGTTPIIVMLSLIYSRSSEVPKTCDAGAVQAQGLSIKDTAEQAKTSSDNLSPGAASLQQQLCRARFLAGS